MRSGHARQIPKQDKRETILQASWHLIRQYGYHKTTVDEIARDAGVAKGTIYLYFKSKADIMLTLVDMTNLRIANEQEKIASGDISPEEKLKARLRHRIMTLYDIIKKHPHGQEMATSLLPEIVQRLNWYVQRHGALLGKIIQEGCEKGMFNSEDPLMTGQMLARLFEHLTPPYYRFDSRKVLDQFTTQLIDLLLSGLWRRDLRRRELVQ